MSTGQIRQALENVLLCFVNACDSSRTAFSERAFNSFSLARSILEAGPYLLGSRWALSDTSASRFAPTFYRALLKENKPIGQAVTEARCICLRADPRDIAWATYVLYGDPRVSFSKAPV